MENKGYTDIQLRDATQVAYLDFINNSINDLRAAGNNGPYVLKDLILANVDTEKAEFELHFKENGGSINDLGVEELVRYLTLSDFDKNIIKGLSEETLNWKIADIHNTNEENGFYGCVIETSEENAIVAFRGSEGYKHDYSGIVNDWIKADFGLVQNESTEQQLEVERYLDSLAEGNVLDKYNFLASTGHSLGGNLATHFAVASTMDKDRKSISDKLGQVVSFDGPGFSKEYLSKYHDGIKESSDKIKHYKWSLVGSVLNDIPGENIEYLGVKENPYQDNMIGNTKYSFMRHSIDSLNFSKTGKAIRGEQDVLSKYIHSLSVKIEYVPFKQVLDAIIPKDVKFEVGLVKHALYQKDNGKIGFSLRFNKPHEMKFENNDNLVCGDIMKTMDAKRAQNAKGGQDDVISALANDYKFCSAENLKTTTQNLRAAYTEKTKEDVQTEKTEEENMI